MKKKYENPTLNIVHLKPTKMIMSSETVPVGDDVTSASGAEAKGGMFWSDDSEDEDYYYEE